MISIGNNALRIENDDRQVCLLRSFQSVRGDMGESREADVEKTEEVAV
jgi:hypothetical protein